MAARSVDSADTPRQCSDREKAGGDDEIGKEDMARESRNGVRIACPRGRSRQEEGDGSARGVQAGFSR